MTNETKKVTVVIADYTKTLFEDVYIMNNDLCAKNAFGESTIISGLQSSFGSKKIRTKKQIVFFPRKLLSIRALNNNFHQIIYSTNNITRVKHNFNQIEFLLMIFLCTKIGANKSPNKKRDINSQRTVKFFLKDFFDFFGYNYVSGEKYNNLKDAITKLSNTIIYTSTKEEIFKITNHDLWWKNNEKPREISLEISKEFFDYIVYEAKSQIPLNLEILKQIKNSSFQIEFFIWFSWISSFFKNTKPLNLKVLKEDFFPETTIYNFKKSLENILDSLKEKIDFKFEITDKSLIFAPIDDKVLFVPKTKSISPISVKSIDEEDYLPYKTSQYETCIDSFNNAMFAKLCHEFDIASNKEQLIRTILNKLLLSDAIKAINAARIYIIGLNVKKEGKYVNRLAILIKALSNQWKPKYQSDDINFYVKHIKEKDYNVNNDKIIENVIDAQETNNEIYENKIEVAHFSHEKMLLNNIIPKSELSEIRQIVIGTKKIYNEIVANFDQKLKTKEFWDNILNGNFVNINKYEFHLDQSPNKFKDEVASCDITKKTAELFQKYVDYYNQKYRQELVLVRKIKKFKQNITEEIIGIFNYSEIKHLLDKLSDSLGEKFVKPNVTNLDIKILKHLYNIEEEQIDLFRNNKLLSKIEVIENDKVNPSELINTKPLPENMIDAGFIYRELFIGNVKIIEITDNKLSDKNNIWDNNSIIPKNNSYEEEFEYCTNKIKEQGNLNNIIIIREFSKFGKYILYDLTDRVNKNSILMELIKQESDKHNISIEHIFNNSNNSKAPQIQKPREKFVIENQTLVEFKKNEDLFFEERKNYYGNFLVYFDPFFNKPRPKIYRELIIGNQVRIIDNIFFEEKDHEFDEWINPQIMKHAIFKKEQRNRAIKFFCNQPENKIFFRQIIGFNEYIILIDDYNLVSPPLLEKIISKCKKNNIKCEFDRGEILITKQKSFFKFLGKGSKRKNL